MGKKAFAGSKRPFAIRKEREERTMNSDQNKRFQPLLFAGDINVYSVARAFHEAYGITSYCYGKFPSGPCMDSKIIHYTANEQADVPEVFHKLVCDFAEAHKDETVILMGCGDSYVELAARYKNDFPENVVAPYIDVELMDRLIDKEQFYQLCEKMGVDYPKTFIHRKDMGIDVELPFEAPYIVKPASGIEYWKHPFEGQKKVYIAKDYKEFQNILIDIYTAGYNDALIIQEFIPGDDSAMRVLTSYSGKDGKVRMMCLGHVLLEEHTPHGIGNHACIITEHNEEVEQQFRALLEEIGFVGFSNFDIKYDARDGKYKAFEINTRQGRSNYYVTNAGANVAKLVVEDYIENKPQEFYAVTEEHLWTVVPNSVMKTYIKDPANRARVKALQKAGKAANPLKYAYDNGIKRRLRVTKSLLGQNVKFKKYLGK